MTREEAMQWLSQAAAQGHSAAERELSALQQEVRAEAASAGSPVAAPVAGEASPLRTL
jgi:TPR repeat protein